MQSSPKRSLYRAALLAFSLCIGMPAHASATASPPTLASFFHNPAFGPAMLSPNAKYLAVGSGAPGRRDFLVVIDLATNKPTVVAQFDDADIGQYRWVNEERLVFDVLDKKAGVGDRRYAPGLFAVNRDGTRFEQLASRSQGVLSKEEQKMRKMLPWNTYLLEQQGMQDSDFIYVRSPAYDTSREIRHVDLLKLNTLTGHVQKVARPKPFKEWVLDHKGEPRLGLANDDGTTTVSYLDPATSEWRQIASFASYGKPADAFDPVGFGPDGALYVSANAGRDASALYTFNFKTGKVNPEPVVLTGRYDFEGELVRNRSSLLGVRFTTDAEGNEWFDPGMKALQEKLDKLLPATVNLISVPAAADSPWVLITSYSDVVPRMYTLYHMQTGTLNLVGSSRPAINSAQMGPQQAVTYKARDGLEIPALLTLPRGGTRKNLPMVVLVHGGPWVPGASWGWNADSQFLASRGYAVLEPSFRGTTGLGRKHYLASWKQWGLSMQDDIADGTRWAIAQGIADPKRICIAGASYGGYATLMGLVKDPDLYKCGVNWVGVSDINLMYNDSWTYRSDLTDDWRKYGMPVLIGDKEKDAAQLKATSPIEQAARLTQPLLMAYGGNDERVPLHHGKKFLEAVQRTNKNVEWIEYPEEGHGWQLTKNRIDFWKRVEKFLNQHIGK